MPINEGAVIKGRSGAVYTLEKEVGEGGEGRVFSVQGQRLVAKIYKKISGNIEKKIIYMVDHPVYNLADANGDPVMLLAWPKDVLYDETGAFVGYVMPYIQRGIGIFNIARGCDTQDAKNLFPNYTRIHNVVVAVNLSRTIAHLHAHNCVVGDMNCKNIMIGPKCCVIILDNDSFDITDSSTGDHYKCTAGTQEYLAPELQGQNLHLESVKFTKETDCFSLAVHLFQLLMNNFHPFTGKNLTTAVDSSSVNQQLYNIKNGNCPFVKKVAGMEIPVAAPILSEMLPSDLVDNFKQTFTYDAAMVANRSFSRVTAEKWSNDLYAYLLRLRPEAERVTCPNDHTHIYVGSVGVCGLCAARKRYEDFIGSRPTRRPSASGVVKTAAQSTAAAQSQKTAQGNMGTVSSTAGSSSSSRSTASIANSVSSNAANSYQTTGSSNTGRTSSSGRSSYSGSSSSSYSSTPQKKRSPLVGIVACIVAFAVASAVAGAIAENDTPKHKENRDSYEQQDTHEYGQWVLDKDGDEFDDFFIYKLDSPIENVKSFSLNYDVEIDDGLTCGSWDIYIRSHRKWEYAGTMYGSGSKDEMYKRVNLEHPTRIEAIAVYPDTEEAMSWSHEIELYDVTTDKSGSGEQSGGSEWKSFSWSAETYNINGVQTHSAVLDSPMYSCEKFKVEIDVEMNYNTSCKDWYIYAWYDNNWHQVGSVYVPSGNGKGEGTAYVFGGENIKHVAVVPKISGSYSWSMGMTIYDLS